MIILIEPQCWGFEHATFNAAFLEMVSFAYPEENIEYQGEKSQIDCIRNILEQYHAKSPKRIIWKEISIPSRNETGWLRFFKEWKHYGNFLKYAVCQNTNKVFFTSVTNTGILVLKLKFRKYQTSLSIIAVMHGFLYTLVGKWPKKPWNWPLSLRIVIKLPQKNNLKYLVLGKSIYQSVEKVQPQIISHFRFIDIPTFQYDDSPDGFKLISSPVKLIFGFIGVGNKTKGISSFARFAKNYHGLGKNIEFLLVGYLSTWRDSADYSFVSGISEQPLTMEEYKRRAQSITYNINTSNPEHYRFGGCSSFIDALFFGKPGVYLRNNFIEYYFSVMGDIGYLCDSYEEMLTTISQIIDEFPLSRYNKQVENIINGRNIMSPKYLAPQIRNIIDN